MSGRSGQNTPKGWPGRQPSLHGILMVDTVRGAIRVRQWPRPRGKNRNETNKWWSEWLRQAMLLWKYSDPRSQELWRQATKDLPVKTTDPYIQAIRGTIWYFQTDDGSTLYPTQARDKVSYSLDAIEQLPGGMLTRGPDDWQGIHPAELDEYSILIVTPQALPHWIRAADSPVTPGVIGIDLNGPPNLSIPSNTTTAIPWSNGFDHPDNTTLWSSGDPTHVIAPFSGWMRWSLFVNYLNMPSTIWNLQVIHSAMGTISAQDVYFPNSANPW